MQPPGPRRTLPYLPINVRVPFIFLFHCDSFHQCQWRLVTGCSAMRSLDHRHSLFRLPYFYTPLFRRSSPPQDLRFSRLHVPCGVEGFCQMLVQTAGGVIDVDGIGANSQMSVPGVVKAAGDGGPAYLPRKLKVRRLVPIVRGGVGLEAADSGRGGGADADGKQSGDAGRVAQRQAGGRGGRGGGGGGNGSGSADQEPFVLVLDGRKGWPGSWIRANVDAGTVLIGRATAIAWR